MAIKTVEMTRQIRDKHHEETKNLSPEEQRKFFTCKAQEIARQIATRKDAARR